MSNSRCYCQCTLCPSLWWLTTRVVPYDSWLWDIDRASCCFDFPVSFFCLKTNTLLITLLVSTTFSPWACLMFTIPFSLYLARRLSSLWSLPLASLTMPHKLLVNCALGWRPPLIGCLWVPLISLSYFLCLSRAPKQGRFVLGALTVGLTSPLPVGYQCYLRRALASA